MSQTMTSPLRYFNDPVLHRPCSPLGQKPADFDAIVRQMLEVCKNHRGVGLAAPQAGAPFRLIVMKPNKHLPATVMVNPEIIERSARTITADEGCLSFPSVYVPIERHWSVRVKFLDRNWTERVQLFTGFDARIAQHEIDHLDGVCKVGAAWVGGRGTK